jgi:hypothetical protein
MIKCPSCGSQQSGSICHVCSPNRLDTILGQLFLQCTPSRVIDPKGRLFGRKSNRFWTSKKVAASSAALLIAVFIVVGGVYHGHSGPSILCTNGAVNYPSCDSCNSPEQYNASTHTCSCTGGYLNPPYCNRYCVNSAVNPPNCDICQNEGTDLHCNPYG